MFGSAVIEESRLLSKSLMKIGEGWKRRARSAK